ncbi:MAG: putative leucyl-tRNA synthetase, partial [Candidatus Bathyarchaeota archaeon B26-2]
PDATYVEAQVDGEKWIVSKKSVEKLSEQLKKVKVLREFKGRELIGRYFRDPITGRKLPILPGWFVDPESATGIVYSVPAHAPADWIAIRDLAENPEKLKEFGIDPKVVEEIKPISLISVEGYGDYPAVEAVESMGVKDQFDPMVDEATSVIYRKEFHTGVLKPICGKYAGRLVREVKAELIEDFKRLGIADSMYDLPSKVICRCTTRCIVKILSDQWFLRYSDPEWKRLTHEAVDEAKIFPEVAREYFHDKIDWLHDWACARRTGLGTPLPWSPGWIVETLSDSTIYMAFYTIRKHILRYGIKPEQLIDEAFDYIFLGKGDLEDVSRKSGIAPEVLREMREEFLYWYPVDLRVSAKELVPNHLSFFFFQHVAIFPRGMWPRGVGVNGMLTIEGEKMSKSKGNFITLKRAVTQYGADVTRLTLLLSAQDLDDPDWREENARSIDAKLKALRNFVLEISSRSGEAEESHLDRWLTGAIQNRIKEVTDALTTLKTRTAAEVALFEVWNDIKWYLRRVEKPNPSLLKEITEIWVRLLAPFAPFICEELWHILGGEGFVSTAPWPKYDPSRIDVQAEEAESLIKGLMGDTSNIMRATKIEPKKVTYYVAASWKWKTYLKVMEEAVSSEKVEMRNLMRRLMKDPELRKRAGEVAKFVGSLIAEVNQMPAEKRERILKVGTLDEEKILKDAARFFEKTFNAEVATYREDDPQRYDPKGRSSLAKPYRPAIYIE